MMDAEFFAGGIMMGGVLWMVVMAALLVIPFWKILPRSGIPSWIALFAFIPFIALILLWVVAFKGDNGSSGDNA
ncbi:MAG: hypothetical protein QM492_02845 [Rhodobacterales bacterium]